MPRTPGNLHLRRMTKPLSTTAALVAAALALPGFMVGCVGYTTYPEVEGGFARDNPNAMPTPIVLAESLERIVRRYPPTLDGSSTSFAVNLPAGTTYKTAQRIVEKLGPGANVLQPGTENLPKYHIGRVWIRTTRAKVDVFRPVAALNDDGSPNAASGPIGYQAITIWLEGGLGPNWRVIREQPWALGAVEVPALNIIRPEVPENPYGEPADADTDWDTAGDVPPARYAEPAPTSTPASRPTASPANGASYTPSGGSSGGPGLHSGERGLFVPTQPQRRPEPMPTGGPDVVEITNS